MWFAQPIIETKSKRQPDSIERLTRRTQFSCREQNLNRTLIGPLYSELVYQLADQRYPDIIRQPRKPSTTS